MGRGFVFQRLADSVQTGEDSAKLGSIDVGQVTIASGQTSGTASVPEAAGNARAILSPTESLGSATKFWAEVDSDVLTAYVDQNPAKDVTFNYLLFDVVG